MRLSDIDRIDTRVTKETTEWQYFIDKCLIHSRRAQYHKPTSYQPAVHLLTFVIRLFAVQVHNTRSKRL